MKNQIVNHDERYIAEVTPQSELVVTMGGGLGGQPHTDAFGRLRVSEPQTVFNNTFVSDLNPLEFSNSLVGNGAITHVPAQASARLSTGGTASGDKAVLQTKRYVRYQPGKSQQVFLTSNLGAPKANVRQRVGLFDDNNGLFFEQTEAGASVNIRTSTSGSPVITSIPQSDWNIDTLDGMGPSGINLDLSQAQIFVIDFQWLGVGRIRFGFDINGLLYYCHEVLNANQSVIVYMATPHLPVRAEIENTAIAASLTTMDQFCMSVCSEGGVDEGVPKPFAAGRGITPLGVTTRRPVLSLRPRTTFNSLTNRGHITLASHQIVVNTNNVLWELVLNGSLTGASFANVDTVNSIADIDTAATAITGGVVIARGFAVAGGGTGTIQTSTSQLSDALKHFELYNDFTGLAPDTLSLVMTSFTATSNINACFNWTEQK